MTIEAIEYIGNALTSAGINYEFGQWSGAEIPSDYFVGEYTEIEPMNEDGLHEATFMLTGTSTFSWLSLQEAKEKIEDLFPSVCREVVKLSNGSRLAVWFATSFIVPTDTMEIKRIQINLSIKEWMVK